MPGKTSYHVDSWYQGFLGFNEAPAKCRGKPRNQYISDMTNAYASMRPQRNAGENASRQRREPARRKSFNEAPAKCRGKPR